MTNEDIITALRNGIQYGEDLNLTKKILINSGYNPRDIEEASRYVGAGVMTHLQVRPEEELIMPAQKTITGNIKQTPTLALNPSIQAQQIKQSITPQTQQSLQTRQTVKRGTWIKEIILLGILLILVGTLIISIFFKDTIIGILGG